MKYLSVLFVFLILSGCASLQSASIGRVGDFLADKEDQITVLCEQFKDPRCDDAAKGLVVAGKLSERLQKILDEAMAAYAEVKAAAKEAKGAK